MKRLVFTLALASLTAMAQRMPSGVSYIEATYTANFGAFIPPIWTYTEFGITSTDSSVTGFCVIASVHGRIERRFATVSPTGYAVVIFIGSPAQIHLLDIAERR